jgi:SAM-dependent methyltransferase
MIDRRSEYLKMASVEDALWWYRSLHTLVLDTLSACRRPAESAILDAGCGTGGLMQSLLKRGYRNVKGFDLSTDAIEICLERGLDVRKGDITEIDAVWRETFDVVISNDVLCYLDEAQGRSTLLKVHAVLKPGGLFMGNLPAFNAFAGIHDISVGIRRRSSRAAFMEWVRPEQFESVSMLYWPFFLSPIVFAARLWQRIRIRFDRNLEIQSDIDLPPRLINQLLFRIVRVENAVFKKKPWGSSLFFVIRKRA